MGKSIYKTVYEHKDIKECHDIPKKICEHLKEKVCHEDEHSHKEVCQYESHEKCHEEHKEICEHHDVKIPHHEEIKVPKTVCHFQKHSSFSGHRTTQTFIPDTLDSVPQAITPDTTQDTVALAVVSAVAILADRFVLICHICFRIHNWIST